MDSLDFNTRLPPRKRLLAGLRKRVSECDFQLSFPSISSDMCARLCDLLSLAASSQEEIVEASRVAALAAAEAAARARANAVEKAALAVKARSAAREALELLDTVAMNEARRKGFLARSKLRKKHIAVKLLYKTKRPVKVLETDEEVARRLHLAMNTSPRFSYKLRKKQQISGAKAASDGNVICISNSAALADEDVQLVDGVSVDKIEDKVIPSPKAALLERVFAGGKKVKVKRKKLSLSQCNIRDQGKTGMLNGEPKLNSLETKMSLNDKGTCREGMVSMKINSMWKCRKFKMSKRSSDSKIVRTLDSNPSVKKPSAMVEVD